LGTYESANRPALFKRAIQETARNRLLGQGLGELGL
jgi:hypothetical protein